MDYKFPFPMGIYFPILKFMAKKKEIFHIRLYVVLVQETDAIFTSESQRLKLSQKYLLWWHRNTQNYTTQKSKFWEKKNVQFTL